MFHEWRRLYQPQVEFFTPCGAVATGGGIVFVPSLSVLLIHGRSSDPEMGPYLPRVAPTLRTPG